MAYLSTAEIRQIWKTYNALGNPSYALVGKLTGHSANTVSKYITLCQQALEAQSRQKQAVQSAVNAIAASEMATKKDLENAIRLIISTRGKF
jgi:hypothetical protein